MLQYIIINIINRTKKTKPYINPKVKVTFETFEHFICFEMSDTCLLLFLVQIKGLGWSLSNRGDEVSMCHFTETFVLVEKHNCFA